jgi:GNAT superfamily N-acetyltransferase
MNYQLLGPSEALPYVHMTYPHYQARLMQEGNGQLRFLAWGAQKDGRPLGLLLAELNLKAQKAKLLSLYTEPVFRRQGIAKGLLQRAEAHLRQEGMQTLLANYSTTNKNHPLLENLLRSQAWGEPRQLGVIVYIEVTPEDYPLFTTATPVGALGTDLPEGYQYRAWLEVPPNALAALKAKIQAEGKIAFADNPFLNGTDDIVDPSSVALEHKGEFVGWAICHHLPPNRLRFTVWYLDSRHRGQKLGLKLVNEVARRNINAHQPGQHSRYTFQAALTTEVTLAYIQALQLGISDLITVEENRLMEKRLG